MMYSSSKATVVAAAAKEGATADHLVRKTHRQEKHLPRLVVANVSGVYDLFRYTMPYVDPGLLGAELMII